MCEPYPVSVPAREPERIQAPPSVRNAVKPVPSIRVVVSRIGSQVRQQPCPGASLRLRLSKLRDSSSASLGCRRLMLCPRLPSRSHTGFVARIVEKFNDQVACHGRNRLSPQEGVYLKFVSSRRIEADVELPTCQTACHLASIVTL